MQYKIKKIVLLVFFSLLQIVCLDDSIIPPINVEIKNSTELLNYLESEGDYINSPDMPSIISATEVLNNIEDYLIVDIRTGDEFIAGHIEGAVNLSHDKIIDFLDTTNISVNIKIVVVSSTGQSAAYYNSLLRLYGYTNTFSLGFGMASWNQDFADSWNSACKNSPATTNSFTSDEYPKNDYSDLPDIDLPASGTSIGEKTKSRITDLMKEYYFDSLTIDYESPILRGNPANNYIICFASKGLYNAKLLGINHPQKAVNYIPPPINSDLRSVSNLQTIPADSGIILYSYSGQLSSYATAYLRLLGYKAKTLLFGAHSLYYTSLLSIPSFDSYTFNSTKIMNYPYVTGD